MSDAWLFWDAEKLEGYPHTEAPAPGREGKRSGADSAHRPLRLGLFQDLLIYAAGIVSALVGVGFALLIGSFISAYSMLSDVNRSRYRPIAEYAAAFGLHRGR
ncbi:MAG: hypothetical protein R3174_08270 [Gammaproteobacteria bacterium]|nr:hypothetical protein [Gammaproteobacteria bacterium]